MTQPASPPIRYRTPEETLGRQQQGANGQQPARQPGGG